MGRFTNGGAVHVSDIGIHDALYGFREGLDLVVSQIGHRVVVVCPCELQRLRGRGEPSILGTL